VLQAGPIAAFTEVKAVVARAAKTCLTEGMLADFRAVMYYYRWIIVG
jgi:hypothetical protein